MIHSIRGSVLSIVRAVLWAILIGLFIVGAIHELERRAEQAIILDHTKALS